MFKKLLLLLPLALLVIAACRPTLASAPLEITPQETTPAQVVTPKSPVNASVDVDPRNWPTPDSKPPVLPPPFFNKPDATLEEREAWRKEMEEKGYITKSPATKPIVKGATVTIKGKKIKLPDDAYRDSRITEIYPVAGKKPWETPYLVIVRGNSRIFVAENSGNILREETAPGEQEVFDFLKRALQ